jgi:hypothetical protein
MKMWALLMLSIVFHYLVFISFVLTSVLGVVLLPWFIGITLGALIFRVIFSRSECPLTTYENYLRNNLQLKPSKGFLKDYILHPNTTLLELCVSFQNRK